MGYGWWRRRYERTAQGGEYVSGVDSSAWDGIGWGEMRVAQSGRCSGIQRQAVAGRYWRRQAEAGGDGQDRQRWAGRQASRYTSRQAMHKFMAGIYCFKLSKVGCGHPLSIPGVGRWPCFFING